MAGKPKNRLTERHIAEHGENSVWYKDMLEGIEEDGLVKWVQDCGYALGVLARWINADEGRRGEVESAEKVRAARMVQECLEISDGTGEVERDNLTLMRDKLRIETRMKVARAFDRKYRENGGDVGITGGSITVVLTDFRGHGSQSGRLESAVDVGSTISIGSARQRIENLKDLKVEDE